MTPRFSPVRRLCLGTPPAAAAISQPAYAGQFPRPDRNVPTFDGSVVPEDTEGLSGEGYERVTAASPGRFH